MSTTTVPQPPSFRVDGRCALITGGAGLLGLEHAAALLEIGAKVVLADVDKAALSRASATLSAAGRVMPCRMDVTSLEDITVAKAEIERGFGPVEILINNAAIDPKVAPDGGLEHSRLEHLPLAQWNLEIAVGLTGAFLCAKVFGAAMAERGAGVILNIASDLSVIAPDQRLYRRPGVPEEQQPKKPMTYSVVKAGLVGMTRYLAGYWADRGVRANALSPGGVYTGQPEDFVSRLSDLIPLGRMAAHDEYRAAVQFLCSDASRYMTGQNLIIDGGRSIL